jgi:hypothetical protein
MVQAHLQKIAIIKEFSDEGNNPGSCSEDMSHLMVHHEV